MTISQALIHEITTDTEDYDGIDASNNPLVAFTSDPSTHRQCFEINITDDLILEDTEDFSLQLSLAQGGSNVPVSINPDESTVEIIDDDCKTHNLHSFPCDAKQ